MTKKLHPTFDILALDEAKKYFSSWCNLYQSVPAKQIFMNISFCSEVVANILWATMFVENIMEGEILGQILFCC